MTQLEETDLGADTWVSWSDEMCRCILLKHERRWVLLTPKELTALFAWWGEHAKEVEE